jgi:hypothetical protein
VVVNFAKRHSLQFYTLAAGGAVPFLHHRCLALLLFEHLHGAAADQTVRVFLMVEVVLDFDVGHQSVEAGGDRRPLGVFLANSLFRKDL